MKSPASLTTKPGFRSFSPPVCTCPQPKLFLESKAPCLRDILSSLAPLRKGKLIFICMLTFLRNYSPLILALDWNRWNRSHSAPVSSVGVQSQVVRRNYNQLPLPSIMKCREVLNRKQIMGGKSVGTVHPITCPQLVSSYFWIRRLSQFYNLDAGN